MRRSVYLSLGLVIALAAWMLSGEILDKAKIPQPIAKQAEKRQLMKVQVRDSSALAVMRHITVQGQLEPRRSVELGAETMATVEKIWVDKGDTVSAGQTLVQLSIDDRQAHKAEAESLVAQRRSELAGLKRLGKKNLSTDNAVRLAEAQLAAAEAALVAADLEIERTRIRAPFAGVLEQRPVEQGDLLQKGDPVATVVEIERLLATGQVPQISVAELTPGQPVKVLPSTGEALPGQLDYIARVADSATRSFRIEVAVDNPQRQLAAGMSATLEIPLEEVNAHHISPALLTLGANGDIGVMTLDATDHVVFQPIRLVRSETRGVWIEGLPDQIRLITLGQGFVTVGEQVQPILEADSAEPRVAAMGETW